MKNKTRKNIYIYPKINYKSVPSPNPYISDLEIALSKNYNIANKGYNKSGVLDLFRYIFKTNIFFFNWIENVKQKRFGKSQVIAFCVFLFLAKALRIKIIWVLHDKESHFLENDQWINFTFRLILHNADLIITHAQSGVEFLNSLKEKKTINIKYFIHPIHEPFETIRINEYEKDYDFLIWGSIYPYKGILEFLNHIESNNELGKKIKVCIVGKCVDQKYKKELLQVVNRNTSFFYLDELLSLDKIAEIASHSKFILFTYKSRSVLSSGVLMDSLRMNSNIIAPNFGAFKDMAQFGLVKTYDEFNEIFKILKEYQMSSSVPEQLETFYKENSWNVFSKKIFEEIDKL